MRCVRGVAFVVSPVFVDEEQVEGPRAVVGGGARVATGGLETSVPEEFGHDDQVRASAHKCCRKTCA